MDSEQLQKFQKYLPSKKFSIIIGISAACVLIILIVTSYFGSHNSFNKKIEVAAPVEATGTLGDIISRDSNTNGIADWEESLWGLDPTGDGAVNKKIVDQKKLAAGIDPNATGDGQTLTETDKFSQDLLATLLALQQSGTLNEASITRLADSVGSTIDEKQSTLPTYTIDEMVISNTTTKQARMAYENTLKKLTDQYADLNLGSEFDIIAAGLNDGGQDKMKELDPIAEGYADFSKKIMGLSTPKDAAPYALALANACAGLGKSLAKTENIYTDVLTGMVGIDETVKASDAFDKSAANMAAYFAM